MFRTPPTVFTRIGKNAEMNTMKTFDQIPMPNQMIIMGTMAMRGVAYSAFRNGSKSNRALRYQPMITPKTTPAASARANPMAKLVPLYAMSDSSVPCCRPNTNCFAMADGPLKNRGEIFPADHSACHTPMVIATAEPPRIKASCRSKKLCFGLILLIGRHQRAHALGLLFDQLPD